MKSLLASSAISLLALASAAQAEGSLLLYNWFEYLPQELVDKFSKEYDVKVTMDTYDSNEALAEMRVAGADAAGVGQPHLPAIAAGPSGSGHDAIGGGIDRRSRRRRNVHARMEAQEAQDRVDTIAE